jgi:isopentenyl diphosphate isomerase/L-lactate dehydrogenase-like FMN-dependent dehydrogenase
MATARAAAEAGIVMVLSNRSGKTLEEVASVGAGARWYNTYWVTDRGFVTEMIQRAVAAGYAAIVFTVDVPAIANRERDIRSGLTGDVRAQLAGVGASIKADASWEKVRPIPASWSDLEWLVQTSPVPVIVKGILSPADARQAVDIGVCAVYVSNHGARNLDTAIATIDALPNVVDAIQGQVEVYLDGGVRRGTDVVKALALGARAVGLGRAPVWGLATNGQQGVADVIRMLTEETRIAMIMTGQTRVTEVDRHVVSNWR